MKKFTLMLLLVLVSGATSVFAQTRSISGKVIDAETKAPVVGATIIVQGTQNGAYSLEDGTFVVPNVRGAVTLEVSFAGYSDKVVPVAANVTNVNIDLVPSAIKLDEVVVVAFGQADKKSLTGSVAVVSSDKIESRPVTNVASAIAGAAPGVQVASAGGAPGSDPSIRIRGIGSINASNAPLYVVDGIPYSGDLTALSSNDIASMSILKDAASTALYGARGSNGVIMITTKSGRKDRINFDVKVSEGFVVRAQPEYDKIGVEDYYKFQWELYRNDQLYNANKSMSVANTNATNDFLKENIGYNIMRDKNTGLQIPNNQLVTTIPYTDNSQYYYPVLNPNAEIMPGYRDDLDWYKAVSRVGFRQNYNLSASGGSDKADYYTSLGYTNEEGYVDYTSYKRINARTNVNVKPTKWLKMGTRLSAVLGDYANPFGTGSTSYINPWYYVRSIAPVFPVNLHDGATGDYILDANGNKQYDRGTAYDDGTYSKPKRQQFTDRHVLWEGSLNKSTTQSLQLFGQAYAEITFLKDFTFTVDGTLSRLYSFAKSYDNGIIGDGSGSGGRASSRQSNGFDYNLKQMLTWNHQFGKHNANILVGHENYQREYQYLYAYKTGQILDGIYELNNFSAMNSMSGYLDTYRTEGYFMRANYNYDNKYFLNGSYRRDGSSKFAPENRWGNFWSVGASWIISSEDFMSNASWVDMLKFRASYGSVGNDGGGSVGYYAWQGLYFSTKYNTLPAVAWSTNGSPNLYWETNNTLDIGVDFRFFNRLNGSIDFFDRSSSGLIFSVPRPYSSGVTSEDMNIGGMYNRGIEFAFDVDAIRTKDWTWNIGVNGTWYKNQVTSLPADQRKVGITSGSKKRMEGYSIYQYWLPQFQYVDPQDGLSVYLWDPINTDGETPRTWKPDANHFEKDGVRYTKLSTDYKYNWSGDAIPALSGGLTTSLSWKNLSLSVLFTYKIGGKSIDYSYNNLLAGSGNDAKSVDALKAWRFPGDVTTVPRINTTANSLAIHSLSTRHLIDGSYIALQNVTLSYAFPKKIAQKLTLSGLSVYASGDNLWQKSAIRGFDATSSFDGTVDNTRFAAAATVTFGVNVSF